MYLQYCKLRVQHHFFFKTMHITSIFSANHEDEVLELPFFDTHVPAGFPSPAQDYMQTTLDLNKYIVKNKEATFYMRAEGEEMNDFNVRSKDILVVDRSFVPHDGNMVIVAVDGQLVLRRFRKMGKRVFLTLGNDDDAQEISYSGIGEASIEIWGTVTFVVHDVT